MGADGRYAGHRLGVIETDAVMLDAMQLLKRADNQGQSVVFYDLTTIRVEGLATLTGDVREFGMANEDIVARQFMLGVVQTADGLPIYHEVFAGNAAETRTLQPTLTTALECFPQVCRSILVADRGLLSLDNLEVLQAIRRASGQPLEFIIAVPVNERIDTLISQGEQWAGKLVDQDGGVKHRGRKLSDSGAKARFYHVVCEAHPSKIIKVDLPAGRTLQLRH